MQLDDGYCISCILIHSTQQGYQLIAMLWPYMVNESIIMPAKDFFSLYVFSRGGYKYWRKSFVE